MKVIRNDGTYEILENFKGGKWDAINIIRVKDQGREYIDLGDVDIAAEVEPPRGSFELMYLSDGARYYLE